MSYPDFMEIKYRGKELISLEKLKALLGYPSDERLERGPVAVIECIQQIPCNPCETACRFNAIVIGEPITNLPHLVEEKCRGCGECIPSCPGLAIFLVNRAYSDKEAAISMPYEYLPLPETDDLVDALDRWGIKVCIGKVLRISNPEKNDNTVVVTIVIPKEYADEVRNFRMAQEV